MLLGGLLLCAGCAPAGGSPPSTPTSPEAPEAPAAEPLLPADVPPFEPTVLPVRRHADLEALRRARWDQPVAGAVLLDPGATVHSTRAAAVANRSAIPAVPRIEADAAPRGLLLEVMADHGDVVEVKTPASVSGHCGRPIMPLAFHRFALRGFVRKRDLMLVVTDVAEVTFRDGTGAAVAEGVVVGQPEVPLHGEPAVAADGFAAELPIPLDKIGFGYEPDALVAPSRSDDWRLPAVTVSFRGRPWWRTTEYYHRGFEEAGETEDGTVLHLGGRCMSVWVLSPEPLVAVGRGGGGAAGIGMLGRGRAEPETKIVQRSYAVKGAEVRWADGTAAGEVRVRYRVHDGALSGTHCVSFDDVKLDQQLCLPPDSYVVEDEEIRVWPGRR